MITRVLCHLEGTGLRIIPAFVLDKSERIVKALSSTESKHWDNARPGKMPSRRAQWSRGSTSAARDICSATSVAEESQV